MELCKVILRMLRDYQKDDPLGAELSGFTWEDAMFIRSCLVRLDHDDAQGWDDLAHRVAHDSRFGLAVRSFLEDQCITAANVTSLQSCLAGYEQGEIQAWNDLVERSNKNVWFASAVQTLLAAGEMPSQDFNRVLDLFRPEAETLPRPTRKLKLRLMYIERKAGRLIGEARIGWVNSSKTGKTLYYKTKQFQSLKGHGFKSNYIEVGSGEEYWISGPRRDGRDRLYGERLPVHIDEDAREEYWTAIRKQPENIERRVV